MFRISENVGALRELVSGMYEPVVAPLSPITTLEELKQAMTTLANKGQSMGNLASPSKSQAQDFLQEYAIIDSAFPKLMGAHWMSIESSTRYALAANFEQLLTMSVRCKHAHPEVAATLSVRSVVPMPPVPEPESAPKIPQMVQALTARREKLAPQAASPSPSISCTP